VGVGSSKTSGGVESILRRESIRLWHALSAIPILQRLVFVKGCALSAILSTGDYRHRRLPYLKPRCSALTERVHW